MQLFKELQRRNVFRVAIGYIVSSWLIAQVADLVLENIGAPDWVMQSLMLLLALGFPVVVFFAWAFEVTPEGIRRESEVDRSHSGAQVTSRKLDRAILFLLLLALGYFAYDKFVLDPQRDAALVESTKLQENSLQTDELLVAREEAPPRTGPPMLAVLPFVSSSMGGDSEFFASGIHDDLLTQLAQVQSIRVISRTSVLEYRDTTRNIREIGKALGADAVLEGGVQSAGDRIRINAQLIDARTDEHMWAQTYDRELSTTSIFEVQTEIARAITSALQATLTKQESTQLAVLPTENMAAYRAYHRAMELRDSRESYDYVAFRQALEEAVTLDPLFTRAWAELVGALSQESFGLDADDTLPQAEEALEQIRALAPESADFLIAQGYYTYYILEDLDLAHQQIKAALALRPSDARIVELKSWIERRMGDFGGRIESIRLARTLDPRNPKWTRQLVLDLIIAHRYREAGSEIDDAGFRDYALSYWDSVLELRDHRDFGLWSETVAVLQKELGDDKDLYDLWETRIASRDFKAAEELARVMQHRPEVGVTKFKGLADKQRTQIITYWFLKEDQRLAERLSEARAEVEEKLKEYGDYTPNNILYDQALLAAAGGHAEETDRLLRLWNRYAAKDVAEEIYFKHQTCRVLGMAGATAAAVNCIRSGLTEPSLVMPFMEAYLPYYDPIRNEPEFVALLAEL